MSSANDFSATVAPPSEPALETGGIPAPMPPEERRRSEWEQTRALLEWELRHYMDSDRKAFLDGVRWGMKRSADLREAQS